MKCGFRSAYGWICTEFMYGMDKVGWRVSVLGGSGKWMDEAGGMMPAEVAWDGSGGRS